MPDNVRRTIEEKVEVVGFAAVKRAAEAMSDCYRAGGAPVRLSDAERTAYLVTRMPATYAAAQAALRQVGHALACPERPIGSVLDIGAGAGAASLAARHWFPGARITAIERDTAMIDASRAWLPDAAYIKADLATASFPPHDLVVASYALGEVDTPPIEALWQAARVAVVVIEPGSQRGYGLLMRIRGELLGRGAHMIAPCPHEAACPLGAGDWCHFAARVERSSLHRRFKGAGLNYEDEKFGYVALARDAVPLAPARIIRRPEQNPGLIRIQVCGPQGVREERIVKRDRELYRAGRRAGWGDPWQPRTL